MLSRPTQTHDTSRRRATHSPACGNHRQRDRRRRGHGIALPTQGIPRLTVLALGASLALSSPARAESRGDSGGDAGADGGDVAEQVRGHITAGIGIANVPSYIGSDQRTTVPTAAAQGQIDGRAFQLDGTSLSVDLVRDTGGTGFKLQAGPAISLRLDRTGRIEDRAVRLLGKRRAAVEPGAWIGIQKTGLLVAPYDSLSANVTVQRDIAGAHGSFIVNPELDYDTPLSRRLFVSVSVSADYVGGKFGAYYYDIDAAGSAASGLPAYSGAGKAGWKDWNGNIMVARSITGDLTHGFKIFATAAYSRLLGRYARSPIVADAGTPDQVSGAIGVGYTF